MKKKLIISCLMMLSFVSYGQVDSDNDGIPDYIENSPCYDKINSQGLVTGPDTILISNLAPGFDLLFVTLNVFNGCTGDTAVMKLNVSITNQTISVFEYTHFNPSNNNVIGSGTNTIISASSLITQLGFEIDNLTLKLFQTSNTCSAGIGLLNSCFSPLDVDNDQIINSLDLDSDNDGSTDSLESNPCTIQIPQFRFPNSGDSTLFVDFSTIPNITGEYFIDIRTFTSCHSRRAHLLGVVDVNEEKIYVSKYEHYGINNAITGDSTNRIISAHHFAKVILYLKGKKLYVKNGGSACGPTAFSRLEPSCVTSMDDINPNTCFAVHPSYMDTMSNGVFHTINKTICSYDSYQFGSQNLNLPGVYTRTLTSNGCDSTVTLYLDTALPNVTANSTIITPCIGEQITLTGGGASTYVWDNGVVDGVAITPTMPNTYTVTGTDVHGCVNTDSVTITIKDTSSFSVADTSCGSYIWTQTGKTYSISGIYNDTLVNSVGCDSIISLHLTVSDTTNIWGQIPIGNTILSTVVNDGDNTDGVGDGAIFANGMTTASGQGILCTFTDNMTLGEIVNIQTYVYNFNASFAQIKVELYNKTDSVVLVTSPSVTIVTFSAASSFFSLNYTITGSDVGDTLQVRYIRTDDGHTARNFAVDNLSINGSFVPLNLTAIPSYSSSLSDTSCDSYTWVQNGMTYTSSGLYRDTVRSLLGCDSIITLNLTINNTSSSSLSDTSCDSYTWVQNGMTYTTSGVYRDTTTNSTGCDSIITLNLTVNNTSSSSLSETSCNSYAWVQNGMTYTSSGVYRDTITNSTGCDSIITLNLTVNNTSSSSLSETSCNSYAWVQNGMTYTSSGVYRDTITNSTGCDSIITLNLTVNNTSSSSLSETSCDSYTWSQNGMTYTTSGVYRDTITNSTGCDSIITLNLTVNNTSSSSLSDTSCDSYTWVQNGMTYTTSGVYRDTTTNSTGCDSIITLNLTVNNTSSSSLSETSCNSYAWVQNGMTYTSSGVYRDTVINSIGCDSIITLNLTVNNTSSSSLSETSCNSYTWVQNGMTYTSSGLYRDTIINSTGCDSIITLNLTVNNINSSSLSEASCDSYTWSQNGMTYTTSGVYRDTIINSTGCDSIITLNLTVNNTSSSSLSETSCDSYTWVQNGMTYTTSGAYIDTITNSTGCDSIITLNLTVNNTSSSSLSDTSCDSYTWVQNGMTYTTSGVYRDTTTNSTGCDSIITLNLTVNNTSSSSLSETSCNSYAWVQNGMTYTFSGVYRDTITNSTGCDSIITLNLTVNNTSSSSLSETSCDSYTWVQNGMTYTTSGVYRDTITNSTGCDSIITMDLTILTVTSDTVTANGCDRFGLPGGKVVTTSGTYRDTLIRSNGCDSIIVTNLILGNSHDVTQVFSLCEGDTVTVGTNIYRTTGIYSDTFSTVSGCDSIINTNLTISPLIISRIYYTENMCEDANSVAFMAVPVGGTWSGLGIDTITGLFDPAIAGVGVHLITYKVGLCGITDSTTVEVYSTPSIIYNLIDDECAVGQGAIDVTITGGTPTMIYSWNTGDITEDLVGLKKGTFILNVIDVNGCAAEETMSILDVQNPDCNYAIFVPNIFSPDGNGENDILKVEGNGIETVDFKVFNRWGNLVFQSSSPGVGWDGTYKGKSVNQGVFVYFTSGTFIDGSSFEKKGTVTVIRR